MLLAWVWEYDMWLLLVHTEVGRMIDATSYYELEAEEYKRKGVMLTPDLWLVKLMVGAVDQSFDEQD